MVFKLQMQDAILKLKRIGIFYPFNISGKIAKLGISVRFLFILDMYRTHKKVFQGFFRSEDSKGSLNTIGSPYK